MLDALSHRLRGILDKLKRRGRLTAADVEEGLREIRLCLLEADVNYKVVKRFIEDIRAKALGAAVLESLTPGQQLIKIVRDELTEILGASKKELSLSKKPAIMMLVGLQGSGKTTTAAKLAKFLNTENRASPLLVATDVRRPAAIEQLKQLGEKLNLPVFSSGQDALEICRGALDFAKVHAHDVLIFDTAGRMQIDEELMKELELMKAKLMPSEILLIADAMTGQEAVNIAQAFHARLELTGIILTKLDGDARGGAALSIVEATGVPIKFIGVGEKLEDLESFYPERMAERILGMGDVLSLIEQAERIAHQDAKRAEELARKIQKEAFTLQDFLEQLEQLKHMGPISKLIEKIPGAGRIQIDERELVKVQAIIHSMTAQERLRPEILNGSRKKRIAKGSGTQVSDVNRLLKRFEEARRLMKQMSKMGRFGRMPLNPFW